MRQQIAQTYTKSQTACSAIRDVESAIGEFAASWLPPDQDFLRVHPHEDSPLAAFHANRVAGLTTLQNRMNVAERRACVEPPPVAPP
jgi:hypothetical protein